MPGEKREHARRQRGLDGAALMFPILAFAEKQPVANEGAQDANAGGRAAIIGCVLHQHVVNRASRVQQHALAAEKLVDQDILLIGALGPHPQGVAAQGPQQPVPIEFPPSGDRAGRDEQVGRWHGQPAAKTWALKSSASRLSSGPRTRSPSTGGTMARRFSTKPCSARGAWRRVT